jgi:hypothetical protein
MASIRGYQFLVPEAKLLASLEGIRIDLEAVIDLCDLMSKVKRDDYSPTMWEALSAATVVRYARCFATGVRMRLTDQMFDGANPDLNDLHSYLIAVRSKHVAHSVNEFEENRVTVSIREDEQAKTFEIQGIGGHHARLVGLAFDEPARVRDLCGWLLQRVHRTAEIERAKLLLVAKEYGAEKIREFGMASSASLITLNTAHKSREHP